MSTNSLRPNAKFQQTQEDIFFYDYSSWTSVNPDNAYATLFVAEAYDDPRKIIINKVEVYSVSDYSTLPANTELQAVFTKDSGTVYAYTTWENGIFRIHLDQSNLTIKQRTFWVSQAYNNDLQIRLINSTTKQPTGEVCNFAFDGYTCNPYIHVTGRYEGDPDPSGTPYPSNWFFTPTSDDLYLHDYFEGDMINTQYSCAVYIDESFPLNSPQSGVLYRIDRIEVATEEFLSLPTYYPSLETCEIIGTLSGYNTLTIPVTQSGRLLVMDLVAAGIPESERTYYADAGPNMSIKCLGEPIPMISKLATADNIHDPGRGLPYMHIVGAIVNSSSSDSSSSSDGATPYPTEEGLIADSRETFQSINPMEERSLDLSANIGDAGGVVIRGILLPTTPRAGYITPNISGWYCRIRDAYSGREITSPATHVYQTSEGMYFGFDNLPVYQRTFYNSQALKISFHRFNGNTTPIVWHIVVSGKDNFNAIWWNQNGKTEKPSIVVYGDVISSSYSSSSSSFSSSLNDFFDENAEEYESGTLEDHTQKLPYSRSASSSSSSSSSTSESPVSIQRKDSQETRNSRVIITPNEKVILAISEYYIDNPPSSSSGEKIIVRWEVARLNARGWHSNWTPVTDSDGNELTGYMVEYTPPEPGIYHVRAIVIEKGFLGDTEETHYYRRRFDDSDGTTIDVDTREEYIIHQLKKDSLGCFSLVSTEKQRTLIHSAVERLSVGKNAFNKEIPLLNENSSEREINIVSDYNKYVLGRLNTYGESRDSAGIKGLRSSYKCNLFLFTEVNATKDINGNRVFEIPVISMFVRNTNQKVAPLVNNWRRKAIKNWKRIRSYIPCETGERVIDAGTGMYKVIGSGISSQRPAECSVPKIHDDGEERITVEGSPVMENLVVKWIFPEAGWLAFSHKHCGILDYDGTWIATSRNYGVVRNFSLNMENYMFAEYIM